MKISEWKKKWKMENGEKIRLEKKFPKNFGKKFRKKKEIDSMVKCTPDIDLIWIESNYGICICDEMDFRDLWGALRRRKSAPPQCPECGRHFCSVPGRRRWFPWTSSWRPFDFPPVRWTFHALSGTASQRWRVPGRLTLPASLRTRHGLWHTAHSIDWLIDC